MALAPEPQGHFLVGTLPVRVDPPQLTVAVNVHGATHACLVGWTPGALVVAGPDAPRLHLFAVDAWPGEAHVGGEVAVAAPGVAVAAPGVAVAAPHVAVQVPGVVVATPRVVVNAPGVVVGAPGVVVGGPGVFVEGPGWGHHHGHRHEH